MVRLRYLFGGMMLIFTLSACNLLDDKGDAALAARQAQVDQAMPAKPSVAALPAVIHAKGNFLGTLSREDHGERLPSRCDQIVTLRSARPLSLSEIAARLSQILQMPVQLDPKLFNDPDDQTQATIKPMPATMADNPPGFPSARAGALPGGNPAGGAAALQFQPDLSGSCREILDRISGEFGVGWHIRDGVLAVDKYRLRTFLLRASATTSQLSSTMSSGGNSATGGGSASGATGASGGANSGGGSGGSSQSATVSVTSDVWSEIDNGLKSLVQQGGKYSISRATGSISVMAAPKVMADVADYIEQMNQILGTTVAVEISAIYITADDIDNYGLDLNALYQTGLQKFSLTGLAPTLATANGSASIAILSPPPGSNSFATHFAGSQLFLNAVSSSNRLADYRSATVSGRNGVAMPVTLTTNQDIVRSVQFAVGLQSGAATSSASTSTINYGFSLQILPRVIAPGIVSVFLSFTANDLTSLENFTVGTTGSLELATIDSRSLWNESPLRVGQTLVIAGTEQQKVNPQKTGFGSPANWLFGGQYKNEVTRTRLILLVTPSIMEMPS
jgi:type IVB pilus formation R64 PilN family outer membrane protein